MNLSETSKIGKPYRNLKDVTSCLIEEIISEHIPQLITNIVQNNRMVICL